MNSKTLVSAYVTFWEQENLKNLFMLLSPNIVVTDINGKVYTGTEQILEYLSKPFPLIVSRKPLVLMDNGKVLFQYQIKKYIFTRNINMIFTTNEDSITSIVVINA